jgi:hypothetical protein
MMGVDAAGAGATVSTRQDNGRTARGAHEGVGR